MLEVLISMGVLLVGLCGVAVLIPAGRFEINQGNKIEQASMVGRGALRDIKTRGFLDVQEWWFDPGSGSAIKVWGNTSISSYGYVIDPLGMTTGVGGFGPYFPASAGASDPRIPRIIPWPHNTADQTPSQSLANVLFRSGHDLNLIDAPKKSDPPLQQMLGSNGVQRSSDGSYTWMATVVAQPNAVLPESKVTVSIAVYYKRDLANGVAAERFTEAAMPNLLSAGLGGGEFVLCYIADTNPKPVKPGQWIMLASSTSANARWYRVIAADEVRTYHPTNMPLPGNFQYFATAYATFQAISLQGPDWPKAAPNATQAWIVDNVVGVYEQEMSLEGIP